MADLIEFMEQQGPHGTLTADATEPIERGYMLTVECVCVRFMRWITEADAVSELTWSSLLAMPN